MENVHDITMALIKVNLGHRDAGKADCRVKTTIGTSASIEHRSIVSINTSTRDCLDVWYDSKEIYGQALKERNEVEFYTVITYFDALDKLETEFDHQANTLKVKWTICDYPVIQNLFQRYESPSFACSKFPKAKWVLATEAQNAGRWGIAGASLIIFKDDVENDVKASVNAKFGDDQMSNSLNVHDFYNLSCNRRAGCPVENLLSKIQGNMLVFEVTIELQVVQDANATINYKAFKQNAALLESGAFSDFAIIAESTLIPVHKNILAPRWPFFKAMLESGMDETNSNSMKMDGFDVDTGKALLEYLYTGSTTVTNVRSALSLMEAAGCYGLTELFSLCEQFVCKYITYKDVLTVLRKCLVLSATKGAEACCKFLCDDFCENLSEYPDFEEFKKFDPYGLGQFFVRYLVYNQ